MKQRPNTERELYEEYNGKAKEFNRGYDEAIKPIFDEYEEATRGALMLRDIKLAPLQDKHRSQLREAWNEYQDKLRAHYEKVVPETVSEDKLLPGELAGMKGKVSEVI